MALDLKIVGGTLVLDGEQVRAGLGIKDGRISQIAAEAYLPQAEETIDASGRLVLPGARRVRCCPRSSTFSGTRGTSR
jgi:dihydropyrimidinase